MRRDFFIKGSLAVTIGSILGGCGLFADPNRLKILGLTGALPNQVVKSFEHKFKRSLELKLEATPAAIWQTLSEAKDNLPDVVSLGDAWLDLAIARNLIKPIGDISEVSLWQNLAPVWQQAATRDGKVWGVPYRWGVTAIAYRKDKLKEPIRNWQDLWQPELKQKLTLPDDAREVVGLVLKKLGYAYTSNSLGTIPELDSNLRSLHDQVLTYSSDNYLQPLIIGDSWVAVGWSQDMVRAQQQNPDIQVVLPEDGSALWTDLWVLPQNPKLETLSWLNFCLEPPIANQITALTNATATMSDISSLPQSVVENDLKLLDPKVLARSELILPLSETAAKDYENAWLQMRN